MQRASDTVIGWGGWGETETDTESGIAGPDGARQSDRANLTFPPSVRRGGPNERGDPRMQEGNKHQRHRRRRQSSHLRSVPLELNVRSHLCFPVRRVPINVSSHLLIGPQQPQHPSLLEQHRTQGSCPLQHPGAEPHLCSQRSAPTAGRRPRTWPIETCHQGPLSECAYLGSTGSGPAALYLGGRRVPAQQPSV